MIIAMETEAEIKKALSYTGFAKRSGHLVVGSELVLSEIRRSAEGKTVLLASDASDRTKKQIRDKCTYYGVPLFEIADSDTLANAIGVKSSVAVLCVTDRSLSGAIENTLCAH